MKYFLDTNIFLRSRLEEDSASHQECLKLLKRIQAGDLMATTCGLVMAEVVWTMNSFYRLKRDVIAETLNGFLNLPNLRIIDKYNYGYGINTFASKPIKYIDAMIASIREIKDGKWAVVSYDRDFDKLGIKRLEPGDIG